MSTIKRRDFLKGGSAVVVAAGVVSALPALPAAAAAAHRAASTDHEAPPVPEAAMSEPLVARVRDARSGEIDLYFGERHLVVRDQVVASRLLRAAT
jgi:hypothetical protein